MMVGMIMWVIFLIWLMSLRHPSQAMRRDDAGNGLYYSLWAILSAGLILGQYHVMAQSSHAALALASDVIGIGIYAVGALVLWMIRRCARMDVSSNRCRASLQNVRTRRS